MLLVLFLILVFSPCVAAYFGSEDRESSPGFRLARRVSGGGLDDRPLTVGPAPMAQQVMLDEIPLADDLVIRSFPKGLAQQRILVQDSLDGRKRHIAELRRAAEVLGEERSVPVTRRAGDGGGCGFG